MKVEWTQNQVLFSITVTQSIKKDKAIAVLKYDRILKSDVKYRFVFDIKTL